MLIHFTLLVNPRLLSSASFQPCDLYNVYFLCKYVSIYFSLKKIQKKNKKKQTNKKEFNGPTAVQSLRNIVSKTRWELRWVSFLFKSWMVPPPPWTPLIISFAYNLGFCCFPTTEIINGDYCIDKFLLFF